MKTLHEARRTEVERRAEPVEALPRRRIGINGWIGIAAVLAAAAAVVAVWQWRGGGEESTGLNLDFSRESTYTPANPFLEVEAALPDVEASIAPSTYTPANQFAEVEMALD